MVGETEFRGEGGQAGLTRFEPVERCPNPQVGAVLRQGLACLGAERSAQVRAGHTKVAGKTVERAEGRVGGSRSRADSASRRRDGKDRCSRPVSSVSPTALRRVGPPARPARTRRRRAAHERTAHGGRDQCARSSAVVARVAAHG